METVAPLWRKIDHKKEWLMSRGFAKKCFTTHFESAFHELFKFQK